MIQMAGEIQVENQAETAQPAPAAPEAPAVPKKEKRMVSFGMYLASSIVLLIVGLAFGYYLPAAGLVPTGMSTAVSCDLPDSQGTIADTTELRASLEEYLNTNFLAPQGLEGAITKVEEYSANLYSVSFDIVQDGETLDSGELYVTKDGSHLILGQLFDLSEEMQQPDAPTLSCEEIPKAEQAELQAFVVSYCPFGVQMQRILVPVARLMPDNVKVRYIGSIVDGELTAMHGEIEAEENLRQICIREEQADKYWDYIECFIQEGKTDFCLIDKGIDRDSLESCMAEPEKGLAYAQEDIDLQSQYPSFGSPTLILNGQMVDEFAFATGKGLTTDQGRSSGVAKDMLCCGFTAPPEACAAEVSYDPVAKSFVAPGEAASTAAGSC